MSKSLSSILQEDQQTITCIISISIFFFIFFIIIIIIVIGDDDDDDDNDDDDDDDDDDDVITKIITMQNETKAVYSMSSIPEVRAYYSMSHQLTVIIDCLSVQYLYIRPA